MCLIIASPKSKSIPLPMLEGAERTNRDGGGVAWFDSKTKKIRWKKGLTAVQIAEVLEKEAKGCPHVVHFRIATVGGVCPELTHPFTIDERASIELEGEADSVLFHNGGVHTWKEILFQAVCAKNVKMPRHPWSDSRGVAFACSVWGPHILSLISDGSRFLVLDAKATAAERMLTWGVWHNKEELMFSNHGGLSLPIVNPPPSVSRDYSVRREEHVPRADRTDFPATRRAPGKYKPNAGFDPWKNLGETGLSLVAANETILSEQAAPRA